MAAGGLSTADIGKVFLESPQVIQNCYAHELETGGLMASAEVSAAILKVARDPRHPQFAQCAFFWKRARDGWRDVRSIDKTQSDLPEDKKNKLIAEILNRMAPSGVFTPEEKAKK